MGETWDFSGHATKHQKRQKRCKCLGLQALSLIALFGLGGVQIHSPRPFTSTQVLNCFIYLIIGSVAQGFGKGFPSRLVKRAILDVLGTSRFLAKNRKTRDSELAGFLLEFSSTTCCVFYWLAILVC
jgi:hypothetical protein